MKKRISVYEPYFIELKMSKIYEDTSIKQRIGMILSTGTNLQEKSIFPTKPGRVLIRQENKTDLTKCRICHFDIKNTSVTPCGHHFCTYCILETLDLVKSCPLCFTRLRETELIRDKEFDQIIQNENMRIAEDEKMRKAKLLRIKEQTDPTTEKDKQLPKLSYELKKAKNKNKSLIHQCEKLRKELKEVKEESGVISADDPWRSPHDRIRQWVIETSAISYDMSNEADNELLIDVPGRKEKGGTVPVLKELQLEHGTYETDGASEGDQSRPPHGNASSDDTSDDGHRDGNKQHDRVFYDSTKRTTKWVIDQAAWKSCIEQDFQNKAAVLLDEGKLPNQSLLNEACLKYKRTQPGLQTICKSICSFIKDQSESFFEVWAAYRYNKGDLSYGNEIVFVVLTNGNDSAHADVKEFTTYKRCIFNVSTKNENEEVKSKETGDLPSPGEIQELESCLKENAKSQMEMHSKLTRVTASWYKSSGFGTDQYSLQKQPCIALYVHVKGYIPLNEEPFSEEIGGYPVDVREGVYILCGGEPNDYHKHVKMGCAIRGQNAGTLGAFIEFENDTSIYGITCAHVLFAGEKLKNIKEKGHVTYDQNTETVYQPVSYTNNRPLGTAVAAVYREGGNGIPGMEIAAINVSQERRPNTGTFPDDANCLEKGFGTDQPFEFYTGNVCESTHLSNSRLVYKYGSETKITEGLCRVKGSSVRTQILTDRILDFTIVMHDQIEIASVHSTAFAVQGDSGALVLTKDRSELLAVGIFEGKMDDVYLVTPMMPILAELQRLANKQCRLKMFQSCNPRPRYLRLFEDMVSEKLERIEQGLAQDLASHKNEIRQNLEVHGNEIRDELRKQNDAQKQQSQVISNQMSVIQNLLLSLTGQNSS